MSEAVGEQSFPTPFGKYLLTDLIAVGGMAEVYRAKIFGASGFEKEMVVKRILPKYAQNPNFVQMLIDEAKIAVHLSHGNIVPIYELGEFDGSYYIAMEYVAGQTVLDLLRAAHAQRRALPWAYALFICAEAAKGLHYAHSRKGPDGKPFGLVHRDVNPRNIVITPDGEVKILDFGIARASTKKHQTQSGIIKGTPGYMSPEQMRGQSIDARSDLYCIGILMHELLTLRRLYPAWTVKEMRKLFESTEVPPPSTVAEQVPEFVDEISLKALAENAADRFQDGAEFEAALRGAIGNASEPATGAGLAEIIAGLEQGAHDTEQVEAEVAQAATVERPATSATADEHTGEHAFILSLAGGDGAKTSPLPASKTRPGEMPKTNVLALNDDLDWGTEIGNDAEVLAVARAAGSAPGQTRNQVLLAASVVLVAIVMAGALYWPQIERTFENMVTGKTQRNGAFVVKTKPAGARVVIDGKVKGKTNIRVAGIDPDETHQLIVEPVGKDAIVLEIGPKDFIMKEGLPTFIFERDFEGKKPKDEEAKTEKAKD